jgi:hypothetical protein
LNGCSGFLFFGYGIAVMPRKLNQYSPDFVFMQAILKALNQGQKEQSEPRTSRENLCRANRANQVPDGIVRSAELEAARGQRLYREAGSKNAKKIRVDVTSVQILAVQTERPGDQAEEPLKVH